MAIRTIAAAVMVITGIGLTTSADARCGGRFVGGGVPAALPAAPPVQGVGSGPIDVWQPMVYQGAIVWVPVRYWPDVAPIVLPGDEALAEHRHNAGLGGGPVDANGMPRRRC